MITERFLEITREDLVQMIATRRDALDVKLLLFALKKSTEFEQWLVLRFPSREYEDIEEVCHVWRVKLMTGLVTAIIAFLALPEARRTN